MTYLFFFSSRRRHTRYIGDWSSDVCSSDLPVSSPTARSGTPRRPRSSSSKATPPAARRRAAAIADSRRSEERRVGKECRSGWGQERWEKKQKQEGGSIRIIKVTRTTSTDTN